MNLSPCSWWINGNPLFYYRKWIQPLIQSFYIQLAHSHVPPAGLLWFCVVASTLPPPPSFHTAYRASLNAVLTCTIKLVSQPLTKCIYPLPLSLSIFPPPITQNPAAQLSLSTQHSRFGSICSPPSATFTQNHGGALALLRVFALETSAPVTLEV